MFYLVSGIRSYLPFKDDRICKVAGYYVAPLKAAEYAYFVLLLEPIGDDDERRGIYYTTNQAWYDSAYTYRRTIRDTEFQRLHTLLGE